jgi:hypothetical protein
LKKSLREKLEEKKRGGIGGPPVQLDLTGLMKLMLAGHLPEEKRKINPTQREFIFDPTREKAYMGAAGVAKTSTIVCAGLLRSFLMPGSLGLIARADYNDLMDTTMKTAEEMLNRHPALRAALVDRDKSPPMKWWIRPAVGDDISQITFMGLKDNIGGYKFHWAALDEADEIDEKHVHQVNSRLRADGHSHSLMLAFNPPPKEHWLYTACTGRNFKDQKIAEAIYKLYTPRPNENDENLPEGYHEALAKTMPEDMVARLVRGEWGAVFPGQPCYPQFKYDLHTSFDLPYDEFAPLYRFWDFGYNHPYCCWAQLDFSGRLNILHELKCESIEARPFAARVKMEQELRFPNHEQVIDYGDPAARQKKDTGSTLVELSQEGIQLRYRIATITESMRTVRVCLERIVDGLPLIRFDRAGCPVLISAMRGGYRLDDVVNKTTGERVPLKDGYYDHPADAFRYGVFNLFGGGMTSFGNLPDSIAYDGN